jgi:hypothetical protein
MRRIDCTHSRSLKMLPWFREISTCSIFVSIHTFISLNQDQGSVFKLRDMRAIDSPHEITPRNMMLREKVPNFSIFASIHTSISLHQGNVFKLREMRAIDPSKISSNRIIFGKNFQVEKPEMRWQRSKIKNVANRLSSLSASKRVPYSWGFGRLTHGRVAKVTVLQFIGSNPTSKFSKFHFCLKIEFCLKL